ncbi:AsmA family protein [Pontibacterium sp.]|uniref:AsmA family protein n=1 Tax=Pontibacterium sp. TaxID=2036026 RepID=UPI003517A558
MKTLMKIVGGLVALVILLIVAGGAILGMFFDPNEYKGEIEKIALDEGGVELKIGGDIGWSVFPWLGLELGDISVKYPNKPQLATLSKAQVSVRIPALLSGQVQMSSVVVDGLNLNLVQDGSSNNWAPATSNKDSAEAEQPTAAESAGGTAIALDIDSIAVTNGNLSFEDKQAGTKALVKNLNLTTGKVQDDVAFPLTLSFDAEQYASGSSAPAMTVGSKLDGNVRFNLGKQQYWVKQLNSSITVQGEATGGKPLTLTLAADVTADAAKQAVALENLKVAIANLALSGKLAVNDFAKPAISGALDVAPFDLNKLLSTLGQPAVETTDPNVLKAISLSTELGGPANTITAKGMTLKLDDTTFKGGAAFDLASGSIKLNLKGDSLNADRYMPPTKEQPAQQQQTSAGSDERYSKEPIIPVEPLKGLNIDATLGLDKLHVTKLDIQNVDLVVSAHNGLVKASKINADMYQGTLRNSATLDVRKTPVRIAVKKDIRGIQLGDVLKAAADTDVISGALTSKADITARGRSVYDIVHSLNGTTSINMKDGEIQGIDMAQTVCQGLNTVKSLGINTQEVDKSTPFANLNASTKIVNGVVNNPDLNAALDAMALSGKGKVDLPKESLDYRVGLTIEENLFKKTCSIPDSLEGVEFPVDCKGGFDDNPADMCKPDLAVFENIFKAKAKAKVKAKVDAKKEELKEKLGGSLQEKLGGEEGAKKLLKGLFD